MKKHFLFMSVLASLFMVGCSQEEIAPNGEENGEAMTSYMAVNLVSSDVMGTRAAQGYEDGSSDENHVAKVRFYFFNGVGGAVDVKLQNGSYVNYYDWTPNTANPDETPANPDQSDGTNTNDDIESKLKATIVINTKTGDGIPQRIAAVLNPTGLDNKSKSLSDLKGIVADYATSGENGLTSKGKFVMFNSVGGGGKDFSTTLIEKRHLCKTETEALANPVTIHVERSVAKVRVTLDNNLGFTDNKLALKDKNGKNLNVGGEQVYLQLDGWGLTAETSEGRLVKKINPNWEGDWWYASYRSFWAINSMSPTNTNRYHSYNDIKTSFGKENVLYTNENAQLTNENGVAGPVKERTKFILKGKLCKANGDAFTIVRHLGAHFADSPSETEAENLKELKKSILGQLSANDYNYYYEKDGGREQIGTGDLKIVISTQQENEESKNNCYVYAQLTDDAVNKTWYSSSDATETIAATMINENLAKKEVVDRALVWNSGMTYYYHMIKHLNNQEGVVRNHIYDVKVTKIAGFGTPVYNPDEIIYPEHPEENDHYIAAQINILSWRVVEEDYELEW